MKVLVVAVPSPSGLDEAEYFRSNPCLLAQPRVSLDFFHHSLDTDHCER